MSVERIEITADPEVFAAWQAQGDTSDDGKTFSELKVLWKCGEKIARKRLHAARNAGVLRSGHRKEPDISGRLNHIPVYWLEIPKKTKGRKG
jgi:hypothetical protein